MHWIFAGLLLGATVTTQPSSREVCEAYAVISRDRGAVGECHRSGPPVETPAKVEAAPPAAKPIAVRPAHHHHRHHRSRCFCRSFGSYPIPYFRRPYSLGGGLYAP